jgi:hypothetical protein
MKKTEKLWAFVVISQRKINVFFVEQINPNNKKRGGELQYMPYLLGL